MNGFERLLTHLLPAVKVWAEDMKESAAVLDDEDLKKLNASAQEMFKKYDLDEFDKQRAVTFVNMMKLRNEAAALHPKPESSD